MRVLITTDWYEPVINGVVTSVMNLSRQLRERGHEVKILTLSRTFHSYIEGDVVYAGSIGLGCIYPQARLKIPKAAGDYMEMLLEWKPDIVHSQCEFSTFFLAKRIASELHVPIVHTYHTVYEDYSFMRGSHGHRSCLRRFHDLPVSAAPHRGSLHVCVQDCGRVPIALSSLHRG